MIKFLLLYSIFHCLSGYTYMYSICSGLLYVLEPCLHRGKFVKKAKENKLVMEIKGNRVFFLLANWVWKL